MTNRMTALISIVVLCAGLVLSVFSCDTEQNKNNWDDEETLSGENLYCEQGTPTDLILDNGEEKNFVDLQGQSYYLLSCFLPPAYPSYLSEISVMAKNPDEQKTRLAVFQSTLPANPFGDPFWESEELVLPDMEQFQYNLKGVTEFVQPIYSGSWCIGYYLQDNIQGVLDSSTEELGRTIIGSPEIGWGAVETAGFSGNALHRGVSWECPKARFAGHNCLDARMTTLHLPANLPFLDPSMSTCGEYDDFPDNCIGLQDYSSDVVYHLVVDEKVHLRIELKPKMTEYSGIALYEGCPDLNKCLDRCAIDWRGPQIITHTLDPGDYFILVKGYDSEDEDENCIPDFELTIDYGS